MFFVTWARLEHKWKSWIIIDKSQNLPGAKIFIILVEKLKKLFSKYYMVFGLSRGICNLVMVSHYKAIKDSHHLELGILGTSDVKYCSILPRTTISGVFVIFETPLYLSLLENKNWPKLSEFARCVLLKFKLFPYCFRECFLEITVDSNQFSI